MDGRERGLVAETLGTEYATLRWNMQLEHGIQATESRRNAMEQQYFLFHRKRGVKLRGKYRIR